MTILFPLLATVAGVAGGGAALAAAYSAHVARRVDRDIPPDGDFTEIRGRRIHFRDIGQGKPIVMIHGLAGQMRNFAAVVPLLVAGHRVVLIDRPGSGHSTGRGADSLADQAAIVADLIAQFGLDRPLIVGHSLGGAVSMALALNHTDRIAGLALVAPLTQVQAEIPAAFRGLMIAKPVARAIIANTLTIPMMRLRSAQSREVLFAPEPVHPAFDIDYGGAMLARPRAFYAASSEMVAVNDALAALVARYGEIALPVRILFGEGGSGARRARPRHPDRKRDSRHAMHDRPGRRPYAARHRSRARRRVHRRGTRRLLIAPVQYGVMAQSIGVGTAHPAHLTARRRPC